MLNQRIIRAFFILAALLWSSTAFAQTWDDTFEPGAVHSHMSQEGHKFLVVAAGEANASTRQAATSLEAALRSGSATLVMNDDALGSVVGLDDEAIAQKASALPVDRIAIVRVFAGATADQETVVVTVRDKTGQNLWALSGTRGVALEAQTGASGGLGVSAGAAESVSGSVRASSSDTQAARQEYDEKFLWSYDLLGITQTGIVVSSSTIYQGKYRKNLSSREFYHVVGRPDLAEELASNQTQSLIAGGLGLAGTLGLIGGGTWFLIESIPSESYNSETGEYEKEESNYVGPTVMLGASVAAIIAAVIISPNQIQPVSRSETLKLADQYNQKLKKELGLDDDYSVIPDINQSNSMKFSYEVGPTLGGAHGAIRVDF